MTPPTHVDIVRAHLRIRSGEPVAFHILARALWPSGVLPGFWRGQLAQIIATLRKEMPPGGAIVAIRGKGYLMRVPERRDREPFGGIAAPAPAPQPQQPKKGGGADDLTRWREERAAEAAQRAPPKLRRCLGCAREFKSDGPGHRLCGKCQHRRSEHGEDYSLVGLR